MKVSVVCPNLSNNSLGRATILAELLATDFTVEIVGTTFGDDIWAPAQGGRINCRGVSGVAWPLYAAPFVKLVRLIDGDIVVASKPLPSSFGVALASRHLRRRPLLLDIDDDEIALAPAPPLRWPVLTMLDVLQPNGGRATRMLHRWVSRADAITVASRGLQMEFGGALIRHAKDTEWLRPRPESSHEAKSALGLAGARVVMFLGTPRPWKGVHVAAAAMGRMKNEAILAVIGATPGDPYSEKLAQTPRVKLFEARPLAHLPRLLEAADVVVVPQELQAQSARQLPSKLLDAMSAGKPTVASAVGDMPDILGDGRGVIVPPSDPTALARAIDCLLESPEEAAAMGARARRWSEDNASYPVVRAALLEAIDVAVRNVARS